MIPALSERARHRWTIASRSVLAVFGGYAFAALATASLSLALPLPRPQAVLAATQASFALYAAWIIWAFAARAVGRAWWTALGLCLLPTVHLLMARSA